MKTLEDFLKEILEWAKVTNRKRVRKVVLSWARSWNVDLKSINGPALTEAQLKCFREEMIINWFKLLGRLPDLENFKEAVDEGRDLQDHISWLGTKFGMKYASETHRLPLV